MTSFKAKSTPDLDLSPVVDQPQDHPARVERGSWAVAVPGLVFDSRPSQLRRRNTPNDPLGGTELSPDISARLTSQRGRGEPLPPDVAQYMGDAMGADLGAVRIHTGADSADLARSVQSVAFTQGTDIYFGDGKYAPRTTAGQRLLAHELAHTVQQSGPTGPGTAPIIGRADDPAEADADRIADGVLHVLRRRAADRQGEGPGAFGRGSHPTASPAVLRAMALSAEAELAAEPPAMLPRRTVVSRIQAVRRMPADFGTTATALQSGLASAAVGEPEFDAVISALGRYAALQVADYEARSAAVRGMPALIDAWNDQWIVEVQRLDETQKANAIRRLKALVDAEARELATAGVRVDERRQGVRAARFKGDFLLEQVVQGVTTVTVGDNGLSVTKIQQALTDTAHLGPGRVTGSFDADTEHAVRTFQRDHRMPATGVVDQDTMMALDTLFRRHKVEIAVALSSGITAKGAPGEFVWGSAPPELTADARNLSVADRTAAKDAVKTSAPQPVGGRLRTFVPVIEGLGSYEGRLKCLLRELAHAQYVEMARGKADQRQSGNLLGWGHISNVAKRSKAATDAVFGKYAVGPALAPGVSIHDAWDAKVQQLRDQNSMSDAVYARLDTLMSSEPRIRALDVEHGADQTDSALETIISRVQTEIVTENNNEMGMELLEIHKAWGAFAENGQVYIQRFKQEPIKRNRTAMWALFHTVVHEYLHTLEHSRYRRYRETLAQQNGNFTLREGVVEYLTMTVVDSINYDEALRADVEGEFHDPTVVHPVPNHQPYAELASAEKLAGVVGARNVMAAFFLGDVEKIGGTP